MHQFTCLLILIVVTYLNLSLHCDAKESDKVKKENWPENRDVEDLEECTEHGNQSCFSD